jgi:hypothetical protein
MASHDPAHGSPQATHVTHVTHVPAHGHDHGHHGHHVAPYADQRPAFLGLIVGGIALFAIMWGTVALTNRQFAGHEAPAAKPAAGAPAAGAPAAGATAGTKPAAH